MNARRKAFAEGALELQSDGEPLDGRLQTVPAGVSVVYWTKSEGMADLSEIVPTIGSGEELSLDRIVADLRFDGDLVRAETLPAADHSLRGQLARVTVGGVIPSARRWSFSKLSYLELKVDYRPLHDVEVHAWRFENTLVPNVSASTSLVVPVDADRGLKLCFELRSAEHQRDRVREHGARRLVSRGVPRDRPLAGRCSTVLGFSEEGRRLRLRRGIYLVAPVDLYRGDGPDWSAYQLRSADPADAAGKRVLLRWDRHQRKAALADFPYLVLAVEHAG